MRLLVDTHVLLWFLIDDKKLPHNVKKQLLSEKNQCFISPASHWEIAIKHAKGRLTLQEPLSAIFDTIEESGFQILPITPAHILKLSNLPNAHNDPFDRLLIAQCIAENMTMVTKDQAFKSYPLKNLWK